MWSEEISRVISIWGESISGRVGRRKEREAYVCSIAGSDDETAVKNEFHVACSASFGACGGDVLADVGGWDDDFCFADIVVFNIDDLEKITNVFIVIDDLANTADQVDDSLCHPVAWGGFASENGHAWLELLTLCRAHGLDGEIAVDDAEYVELLTLVLMYTLDLDVKERFRIDGDACGVLDVLSQADLVIMLDRLPFLLELFVIKEVL